MGKRVNYVATGRNNNANIFLQEIVITVSFWTINQNVFELNIILKITSLPDSSIIEMVSSF